MESGYRWLKDRIRRPFESYPENERRACAECHWHSSAPAGRYWDRCANEKARPWDPIGGYDSNPQCAEIRKPGGTCGPSAKYFEPALNGGYEMEEENRRRDEMLRQMFSEQKRRA